MTDKERPSDYGDLIESLRVPCITDIHDDAIAAILALEAALAELKHDLTRHMDIVSSVEAERDAAILEQEHMRRRGEQREEQLKSWVGKYERAAEERDVARAALADLLSAYIYATGSDEVGMEPDALMKNARAALEDK